MKPFILANWKMNKTPREAAAFVRILAQRMDKAAPCEVAIAPSFPALAAVRSLLDSTRLPVELAAQNVHAEQRGAFTGEVSCAMLRALNVRYVIVGHSERRRFFGETDALVAHKTRAVLAAKMTPVLCVGENLAERNTGKVRAVLAKQLHGALGGNPDVSLRRVVVAYEPLWAIGTGQNAAPEDASAAHRFIASWAMRCFGAKPRRILYGGSVTGENAHALLAAPFIEGLLVGGGSLHLNRFTKILREAQR